MNESLADLSTKPKDYFSQTRREMLPAIPPSARRILEIGCGAGTFSRFLKKERGAEVWGVELDPVAAEIARAALDHVRCGDVIEQIASLPAAHFDCIVFNDVLEHLSDPYRVLVAIKRLFTPTGVVVCSIPNIRYFRAFFNFVVRGEWHYEENGTMDKTHLRFFTKKSIAEMFESLGYRILRLEGINATPSWRVRLFTIVTLGFFNDTRYLQFCCVAQPVERGSQLA
ncbi:MAG: class I SAM-dependent methyltransferase [Chthoniobacterales bacterium]